MKKYRVFKTLFHGGEEIAPGTELELSDNVAEVHKTKLELIQTKPKTKKEEE